MARAHAIEAPTLRRKRACQAPVAGDRRRILVDRLWPRGLAKENARIDDFTTDPYWNHPASLARLPSLGDSELATLDEARLRASAKKKCIAELDAKRVAR